MSRIRLSGELCQPPRPLHRKGVQGPVTSPGLHAGRQAGRQACLGLWLIGCRCSCLCRGSCRSQRRSGLLRLLCVVLLGKEWGRVSRARTVLEPQRSEVAGPLEMN